jgi:hypothetical protein
LSSALTVGSVAERSKIPLNKSVLAIYLLSASKKGMSSHPAAPHARPCVLTINRERHHVPGLECPQCFCALVI